MDNPISTILVHYKFDMEPITITKVITFCKYKILIENMSIQESRASIRVILATEFETDIKELIYIIEGDEYNAWGSNEYLVNWVKEKLSKEVF